MPGGIQWIAVLGIHVLSMRRTWPSSLSLLCATVLCNLTELLLRRISLLARFLRARRCCSLETVTVGPKDSQPNASSSLPHDKVEGNQKEEWRQDTVLLDPSSDRKEISVAIFGLNATA